MRVLSKRNKKLRNEPLSKRLSSVLSLLLGGLAAAAGSAEAAMGVFMAGQQA